MWKVTPVYKAPMLNNKFFIFGDFTISLEQRGHLSLEESISITNNYRPVVNVKREFDSNYIRAALDYSTPGLTDFKHLIPMLKSM